MLRRHPLWSAKGTSERPAKLASSCPAAKVMRRRAAERQCPRALMSATESDSRRHAGHGWRVPEGAAGAGKLGLRVHRPRRAGPVPGCPERHRAVRLTLEVARPT